MKCRTFGRTGWQVSEVSLGCAYLGGDESAREQENACEIVHRAKQLGINYLDTAPSYGNSEILLGEALEGIHEDFYIATKVGFDPEDFDYSRDLVLWSLERSLRRLRVPELSLAQIHEVNELVDIADASEMEPLSQRSLEELKRGNRGCDE